MVEDYGLACPMRMFEIFTKQAETETLLRSCVSFLARLCVPQSKERKKDVGASREGAWASTSQTTKTRRCIEQVRHTLTANKAPTFN